MAAVISAEVPRIVKCFQAGYLILPVAKLFSARRIFDAAFGSVLLPCLWENRSDKSFQTHPLSVAILPVLSNKQRCN